jgi:GT2 family glycosyltransferase
MIWEQNAGKGSKKLADVTPPGAKQTDETARAIALVNRLLVVEARVQALALETGVLRARLKTRGAGGPSETAATAHEWKLADDPAQTPETLWLYDRRVDDAVVLEGRAGAAFLDEFLLLTAAPDYAGAIAAINALRPEAEQHVRPDASIIIPVYGQLGYTLNCLHSLSTQQSRYSSEIIIIDDRSPDASGDVLPQINGIRYFRQAQNTGFGASCNEGATHAWGRHILLLNNDTRVVPGWLDGLLDGFTSWPSAGLVGSKLFYPDGSLQEAGGIIWRDGAAWNYGRNDDPNRPAYSYARQVDYISGCSIAIPADLWRQLGGFDDFFRPAYAEDADLAFRIRAAGRLVWLQPQSRVVHYEGKTSGTDTASGAKAYQLRNAKKFFARWRETLQTHRFNGEAPSLERERGVTKRLLVVDVTTPTPDQDAGSVQTVMALRTAIALGYKTYFVPADNWLFQPGYTTALQAMGVECAYAPYELGFEAYMERHGGLFDVVLVYRQNVLETCLDAIRAFAPQAALLFHVADLHYLRMARQAALAADDAAMEAASLMKEREIALVGQADATITHSTAEQAILHGEAPGAAVLVWPLMFDHAGTSMPFAARQNFVFLGGYRHPPNVDAARYFVTEILPLIQAELPDARCILAGSFPPDEVLALASDSVIVTGQVPDLRDIFDPARIFICPLRVGAGAKGKIASALAYGLPVVSTPMGVEGTPLRDGEHVLVAETAAGFAAACVALYDDAALWARLSANGQDFVKRALSMEMGTARLAAAVAAAFAQKLGVQAPEMT